ncbi:MAG: hypothetical protein EAZ89_21655, partial [Bacteroidetes bacterium]
GQPAGSTVSPDGTTLTVPNEGTYTINPTTGVVTFDPLPTFSGTTSPVRYSFEDNADQPSNPALITVNVGAPTRGTVTGLVFRDDNGNGTREPSEPGIGGVDVVITPAGGGTPITVVTQADGTWSATGVPAGNATVNVQETDPDFPTGATLTTTGSDPSTVAVVAGGTVADTQDGYRLPAPVATPNSASTPNDTNVTFPITADDTSSSPLTINPASIDLDPSTPVEDKTRTIAGQGTYTANPDGTVTFDPLPAFVGTTTPIQYTVKDSSGNLSNPANLTVTVGAIGTGSLNGLVFFDDNGNGVKDGSEQGIPNVSVAITPSGGGAAVTVQTNGCLSI